MSTDIRTMPSFGKRATDEAWARAQRGVRELTICPWRFSAWLAGLVAVSFLLLLDSVKLLGGGDAGISPAGEAAVWLSGAPGVAAGLMVLFPAALVAQCACALLGIGLSGQAVVSVQTAGVVILARGGSVIMPWEEVAQIDLAPGLARFERGPRAAPRLCTDPAREKQRARAPILLVSGGSQALKQAIAEIRPDMARRHFT